MGKDEITESGDFLGPHKAGTFPGPTEASLPEPDQVPSTEDRHEKHEEKKSKKTKGKFPLRYQLRKIFLNSWAHISLLLVPAGFALHYTRRNPVAIFFVNFAAMVPSIMIMSLAVDTILMYVGDLLGGLISTTFSNAAQLITSVLLLRSRQLGVLRTSLVGAILSNLLLMPGLGFFVGGIDRLEQFFNVTMAQATSEMLLLAILSLMIPSAGRILTDTPPEGIVKQSRGTAVILIVCYAMYMFFQLKTHRDTYNEPSQKSRRRLKKRQPLNESAAPTAKADMIVPWPIVDPDDEDEKPKPELPLLTAVLTLATFTAMLSFNTLFATDSIQALLLRLDISETFLGIVILPIISNDPTTLIVAIKDKQDLMLALTLGRCVQVTLLVIPFIILLAWMIGIDYMSLSFSAFETLILLAGVLVVNYVVSDGKSNWLIGALLVASYLIVSVSAYYIP
jgi:Ca2+:H+ antiporter